MITIKDLSFAYNNSDFIFRNCSLRLDLSAITFLRGENGSGKSTLCRLLAGLERNFSGSIELNSKNINNLIPTQIAEQILYIQQGALKNLIAATPDSDLAIWQHKFIMQDNPDLQQRREQALKHFKINSIKHKPIWELSNGQSKRIGLAAMLIDEKEYVILDEQTSGLDKKTLSFLKQILKKRKEKNLGALIISHNIEFLHELIDNVIEIKGTKLLKK